MEKRSFDSTNRQLPVIGQGTWYDPGTDDRGAAIAALRLGIDLGMTHIDTAEMYLDGEAENWVADAISGRRDEVFLVSKVLPHNATRSGTIAACERSLKRLETDRLDCYLLHWRGRIPLAETIAAFEQLQHDGKILSWGVSNFDVDDLREAGSAPVTDQVLYYLQERAIEHKLLPWCEQRKIAVVAYSTFGHGQFPSEKTPGGRVLKQIAEAHGATPRQVALRFLLRHQSVFAIPKSSTLEHVRENAAASDLQLSEVEMTQIDRAFPVGPPKPLPMI
jgi:diketogulonate reductase-like aldo/keto reductase